MKFQVISAISLLLSFATAAPSTTQRTFDVMALHSASPIHFAQMSAAKSGLYLNFPLQNATCKGEDSGHATFYIANEELVLYSCEKEKQKVFVDRSGMGTSYSVSLVAKLAVVMVADFDVWETGQGVVGFLTGSQSLPRYGELKGWRVDKDKNLFFKDAGLIACPVSLDGSWRIWLGLGFQTPGGNTGCLGMSARTLDNNKPVSCHYRQN